MYQTEEVRELKKEILVIARPQIIFGMIIFIVLFFGLGGWSVVAKIDKAALAFGEIAASGNNQVVQHLEGGIIEKIHVTDGDIVKKGDVLMTLKEGV